jgi:hypothetical protein
VAEQQSIQAVRTSAVLKKLSKKDGEVALGDAMKETRSRAHGLGLLLFSLPETIPLPVPSLSTILAVPLVLISGHLMLFGEQGGIPKKIRAWCIPASIADKLGRYVAPVFEKLEHVSHHRWEALATRERLLGAVCLILAIILILPIPFGNLPPAVCLAVIAFGMLQRDGVVVALGLAGTVVVCAALAYAVSMAGSLFG